MSYFDEDFDKEFKTMTKLLYAVWVIVMVLAIAIMVGIGFVIYKLLIHFGIM